MRNPFGLLDIEHPVILQKAILSFFLLSGLVVCFLGKAGSVRSCSDDGASLPVLMGVERDAILFRRTPRDLKSLLLIETTVPSASFNDEAMC